MNNCGISRWDDPTEINARLKALTDQPIWEVNDDYYENEVLKYYDEKCTKSKAIYEEAKNYIPGGVQHNLAFNKPFPVAFAKADGAYLYDKDGNEIEAPDKLIPYMKALAPYPYVMITTFFLYTERETFAIANPNVNLWSPSDIIGFDEDRMFYYCDGLNEITEVSGLKFLD